MSNENLIHEYLDGSLDESREAVLFDALARDAGLRREFGDYLNMRPALKNEAFSVATPAGLSAAVFAGLGYTFSGPEQVKNPATGSHLRNFFRNKFFTHSLTVLLSSLVAILLYISFSGPANISGINKPPANPAARNFSKNENQPDLNIQAGNSVPLVISRDNNEKTIIKRHASAFADDDLNVQNFQNVQTDPIINTLTVSEPVLDPPGLKHELSPKPGGFTVPEYAMSQYSKGSSRINIQANNVLTLSSLADDVPSQSDFLKNYFFSAGYYITPKDLVSIEFGREAFGQSYTMKINGIDYLVRQNPALWWTAISLNHNFRRLDILKSINPSARIAVGTTQAGPLAKLSANLNWKPEESIIVSLGLEGAFMIYPVNGTYYITRKAGITYGVNIRF